MAIRTISYSVKSDGISPNTEQQAGLQSEHAVTQLVFTLDSTLYQALLSDKGETDTLVYRFDCFDSMGGAVKTEPSALTGNTVTFTVGENLTRSGGKARVYLVISRYNSGEKTETELLSFPAKLRFENVPETNSDNGDSRESLSTLAEAAKNAADRASLSADTAVEAQGKTEAARLAIEGDSTVIFDGNGTFGKMDVDFVVDTKLSTASDNAIANKAVAEEFLTVEKNIKNRYVLFIGDSYAGDWEVNEFNGWCKSCIKQITALFGKENDTSFQNEHYKTIGIGGIGFSATYDDKNVYNYLQEFIGNNSDFISRVTDVVFALGYNDAFKTTYSAAIDVYTDIEDNIKRCNDIINRHMPHFVNKYLFAVGWGSNPNVRYAANYIYKNVYSYAAKLGWVYGDLRFVMFDSEIYYKDWVHPNKSGSGEIAQRIVNTMLGNSSIITPADKVYKTTVSTGRTATIGQLHIVNSELAQLYLSADVIYEASVQTTMEPYSTMKICEIEGLVPFGEPYPYFLSNVSFHIADTTQNTESNVILGCYISKEQIGNVEGHDVYKSYLNIHNITGYTISFNKIAPNYGVINILPCI